MTFPRGELHHQALVWDFLWRIVPWFILLFPSHNGQDHGYLVRPPYVRPIIDLCAHLSLARAAKRVPVDPTLLPYFICITCALSFDQAQARCVAIVTREYVIKQNQNTSSVCRFARA